MTEQSPLERAARALCELECRDPDEEFGTAENIYPLWHCFIDKARAVLMAVREPSAAMEKAAWATFEPYEGFDGPDVTWPLMIDAALGE